MKNVKIKMLNKDLFFWLNLKIQAKITGATTSMSLPKLTKIQSVILGCRQIALFDLSKIAPNILANKTERSEMLKPVKHVLEDLYFDLLSGNEI